MTVGQRHVLGKRRAIRAARAFETGRRPECVAGAPDCSGSQMMAGVAAWMSFDGLAHNDSRRLFRVAVGCLGEYDWHLRAMLLCDMARKEIW